MAGPGEGSKLSYFTSETAREAGRKGGKASAALRRRRRLIQDALIDLLSLPLIEQNDIDKTAIEILTIAGVPDPTQADALAVAMLLKAKAGDVEAAKFTRDTSGEKPRQGVEIGNLDGQPFEAIDLSKLSDEQLQQRAATRRAETEAE